MSRENITENLKRIRGARRLSQQRLADLSELSLSAYKNIEQGKTEPRVNSLHKISAALNVPLAELLTPVVELRHVHFRSKKKLRTRGQILADVGRWLSDYNELEEILQERSAFKLEGLARELHDGPERAVSAARLARQRLGIGPDEPIRDICGLLESAGVKVFLMQIASDAFFGLSIAPADNGPAVAVNTWERITVERWIFSAAHELGHLILHLDDFRTDAMDEDKEQEREADAFAAQFLMPDPVFRREWDEAYGLGMVARVIKVKRMFRVSYRTVLSRLAPRYRGGGTIWARFQREYKKRHGRTLTRSDEPDRVGDEAFHGGTPATLRGGEPESLSDADFTEDRLPRLIRRAIETEEISLGRGAEIMGVPLGRMRKRAAAWVG